MNQTQKIRTRKIKKLVMFVGFFIITVLIPDTSFAIGGPLSCNEAKGECRDNCKSGETEYYITDAIKTCGGTKSCCVIAPSDNCDTSDLNCYNSISGYDEWTAGTYSCQLSRGLDYKCWKPNPANNKCETSGFSCHPKCNGGTITKYNNYCAGNRCCDPGCQKGDGTAQGYNCVEPSECSGKTEISSLSHHCSSQRICCDVNSSDSEFCLGKDDGTPCTTEKEEEGKCDGDVCVKNPDPDPEFCSGKDDGTPCTTEKEEEGKCDGDVCVKNPDPDPEFCLVEENDGEPCKTDEGDKGICKEKKCVKNSDPDKPCDNLGGDCKTQDACDASDGIKMEEGKSQCGEKICCKSQGDPDPDPDDDECESVEEGIKGGFLFFKGSIVPCGRKCDIESTDVDEMGTCTLCHFIIMFFNIFELLISLLVVVALLFITISGVAFLVSVGNPNLRTTAKNILTKTLIGFGIALLSWLIIFTLLKFISANNDMLGSGGKWNEFKCETESIFDKEGTNPNPPNPDKNLVVNPDNITFIRSSDAQDKEREIKVYNNKKDEKVSVLDNIRIAGAEGEDVTMEAEYSSTDENIAAIFKDEKEKKVIIYSIAHPEDDKKKSAPKEAVVTVKYKEFTTTIDVTLFYATCDE